MPDPMYYSDDDTASRIVVPVAADDVATIRVIAPARLAEGYTFDVMVDDQPYTVEVPRGGVKEGQEFQVLYEPHIFGVGGPKNYSSRSSKRTAAADEDHDDNDGYDYQAEEEDETKIQDLGTMPVQTNSDDEEGGDEKQDDGEENTWYDETTGAPIGRWRTTVCSCCDVLTQSTFWMGVCCTPVLIAQLITRLGLTWNGRSGASKEEISMSFNRIVLAMMFTLAFWKIPIAGDLALLCFYLLIVVHVGSHVRHYMRQKYKIPSRFPTRCGQRMEDSCCMFFCGCCSAIQMARHTHDDKDYPGHGCTTTGLGLDAPHIV